MTPKPPMLLPVHEMSETPEKWPVPVFFPNDKQAVCWMASSQSQFAEYAAEGASFWLDPDAQPIAWKRAGEEKPEEYDEVRIIRKFSGENTVFREGERWIFAGGADQPIGPDDLWLPMSALTGGTR